MRIGYGTHSDMCPGGMLPAITVEIQPCECVRDGVRYSVEVEVVTAVSATSARSNLYRLIDQVNEESQPLTITGQRGNAVLIGEADWQAIQETLFLESVPGFAESIRQARAEGIEAASTELDW